jgi:trehalose 6-phosphate synthase
VDLVIVSNRGPVAFGRDESGRLVGRRGAGGLVSSLGPLVAFSGATWVAAAMSDGDREAATSGLIEESGFRIRLLSPDPERYRMAYEDMSSATLWYLHHRLFDLTRHPHVDERWWDAWDAYREINRCFAEAVMDVAPTGATVLVQDYHLTLLGTALATERPDLHAIHFTHTPFCDASELRVLPDDVAREMLTGMAAHRACGFHTSRWAHAFSGSCHAVLGVTPRTFASPLAPDLESLRKVATSEDCASATDRLDVAVGDRHVILRVDRIEPSKNLLRGFLAFDDLLQRHPEWVGRVVFIAMLYPSRQGLADYVAYRRDTEALVARINERWGRPGWTPVVLDIEDDLPRSVAALRRYDVLLVNPVRDGLNLVAKEGPLLNTRDGVLVLSREAGAWTELKHGALTINPFDVTATTEALAFALGMSDEDRRERAARLRVAAGRRSPQDWLDDQVAAGR